MPEKDPPNSWKVFSKFTGALYENFLNLFRIQLASRIIVWKSGIRKVHVRVEGFLGRIFYTRVRFRINVTFVDQLSMKYVLVSTDQELFESDL